MLYLQILSLTQCHTFSFAYSPAPSLLAMSPLPNMSPTLSHLPTFLGHMQFHWYSSHSLPPTHSYNSQLQQLCI